MGEIQWIELYEVQPNQNMAMVMHQAAMTLSSSRISGLGDIGATVAT